MTEIMDKQQLQETIDLHGKWLRKEDGGQRANLRDANLRDANLRDANLRGANLCDADLCGADLRGANLRGADLWGANLRGADLRGADLRGANLRGANLRGADLRGADLWGANLRGADLRGAGLWGANLCDADLCDASLCGADLRGADLWGCGGNLVNVRSLWIETYQVTYTADVMQIGCQRHAIADWWEFSDERIAGMDSRALAFWNKFKPILKNLIEVAPAEPTGYVEKSTEAKE